MLSQDAAAERRCGLSFLSIIGFIALCLFALYMTFAMGAVVLSEAVFGGPTVFSFVFAAIAIGLWALVWWLSPFTVTVGVAP